MSLVTPCNVFSVEPCMQMATDHYYTPQGHTVVLLDNGTATAANHSISTLENDDV